MADEVIEVRLSPKAIGTLTFPLQADTRALDAGLAEAVRRVRDWERETTAEGDR